MKSLRNWRYYVLLALFTVGVLAITRAFGEPAPQTSNAEWLKQLSYSISIGGACLYAFCKLIKKWEKAVDIPEFENNGDTEG